MGPDEVFSIDLGYLSPGQVRDNLFEALGHAFLGNLGTYPEWPENKPILRILTHPCGGSSRIGLLAPVHILEVTNLAQSWLC